MISGRHRRLAIIAGELPRRARRLVAEWAGVHQDERRSNWQRARSHQPLMPIADGLAADVDLSYLLDYGGVFEPLRDPAYFRQLRAHPEAGTIVWPNEADIAPETLYAHARLCDCIGVVVPNTAAKWS